MCNSYAARTGYREYVEAFSQLKIPLVWPEPSAAPNLEPRDEIRPTDPASIFRARGAGVELAELKWGFKPARPKAPPLTNFRSEGRGFGPRRCLIPASHFYEFTGERYPKTRWRFFVPDEPWFCMAGLWREQEEGWPRSFTMLTTDAGPDLHGYHHRQPVVLPRDGWARWLDPTGEASDLLRPSTAGALRVQAAPRP